MDTARLPDPLLEALAAFIAAHLGLRYPRERWDDLQRHILALAGHCGWEHPERQLRAMLSAPPQRKQVELLARHLCIGETYFFRDPALFAALESQVLPSLAEARRGAGRRLRLWSAGCCSGEEAYSLAIAVTRALPDWRDWHITVHATDIHAGFLDKARAGIYGAWSFRGVDLATRERYFEPAGAGRWRIRPEWARLVSFDYLNLAGSGYPALETDSNAMDLVLCRNVLMYFAPDVARSAVQRLHSALRDDGWLAVSPTEGDSSLLAGFQASSLDGAILHRKCAPLPQQMPPAPARPTPSSRHIAPVVPGGAHRPAPQRAPLPDPWQLAQAAYARGDYAQAVQQLDGAAGAARTLALKARAQANLGRLDEALRTCRAALLRDKCDPALHYLLAMIEQEQGAGAAAEAALKRALFLDQDFVLAHFALANQYRRRGKPREAARHYANVRRLLDAYPPAADLPESDGLSAARLLALVPQQEPAHGH